MDVGDKITVFGVSVLVLAFLGFSFYSNVYAVTKTDVVTISVNVSQLTLVDINPANLTWGAGSTTLNPGSVGTSAEEQNGYEQIWIENIGSTNITSIWFNNSYESSLPFGTGDTAKYDPANMVTISNGTSPYQFVNRVEYNESDTMYLTMPANWEGFGRLRNATQEWFWALVPGAANDCSAVGSQIFISSSPKTQSSTGDTDLTDGATTLNSVGTEGIVNVTIGGEHYCVVVPQNCGYVKFVKWNADEIGKHSSCNNDPYLNGGYLINGTANALVPGAVTSAYVHVHVPYGVPYGVLGTGQTRQLTVLVSNSYSS